VSVHLNHTIVRCSDKQVSSHFYADILGLPAPVVAGPLGNRIELWQPA
jgi:hypothetical protein